MTRYSIRNGGRRPPDETVSLANRSAQAITSSNRSSNSLAVGAFTGTLIGSHATPAAWSDKYRPDAQRLRRTAMTSSTFVQGGFIP